MRQGRETETEKTLPTVYLPDVDVFTIRGFFYSVVVLVKYFTFCFCHFRVYQEKHLNFRFFFLFFLFSIITLNSKKQCIRSVTLSLVGSLVLFRRPFFWLSALFESWLHVIMKQLYNIDISISCPSNIFLFLLPWEVFPNGNQYYYYAFGSHVTLIFFR